MSVNRNFTKARPFGAVLLVGIGIGVFGSLMGNDGSVPGAVEASKTSSARGKVNPGELDEYYGFWSGGQSGEVRVLGLPSMRVLKRIPVFNLDSGSGWGITNESKALLKGTFVGDTHHVHGSYKDGTYDAKYLWVNDKLNNRLARIRVDYLEVDSILSIPNAQGVHGIFPQRYPQTDWVVANSEFRTPVTNDGRGEMGDAKQYRGVHTVVDAEKMEVVCQVIVPTNLDLAATDYTGKYSFATAYNSEGGGTISEMLASDSDYLVVFNWDRIKKALAEGQYEVVDGVKMLDGKPGSGLTLFVPVPKNPHGVNVSPDGKYAIASGKVSPTATVVAIDRLADAFDGKIKPEDTIAAQPEIGLGPLHTTFDGRGNAYTSLFIDSQIVKWNIQKAIDLYKTQTRSRHVVDRLDIHYQVGHTMASMAETKEADGQTISFRSTRSRRIASSTSGRSSRRTISSSTSPARRWSCSRTTRPTSSRTTASSCDATSSSPRSSTGRAWTSIPWPRPRAPSRETANKVTVRMTANAPVYGLQEVVVNEGDEVTFIVTNNDEIPDLAHGFNISNYNINFVVGPFQTKSVTFVANKPGMHWIYCTNFCHALHLEMRMRLIVKAKA